MRRFLPFALVIVCALALAADASGAPVPPDSPTKGQTAPQICYEDEPCWNWATMGNQRRGVVTLEGDFLIVSPCRFQRLWNRGLLRYRVSFNGRTYKTLDRLKGDGTARRMYCGEWRTH